MELKNKVVVITGGTKGFGLEMAKIFLSEGAVVVVCSKEKVDLGEIKSFACDVSNGDQVKKFVDSVVSMFGKIDIFINNAGVWFPDSNFDEVDVERVRNVFNINLVGYFLGSKYASLHMKKIGSGVIMNIISTIALSGRQNLSIYCASKFAVNGFTQSIRAELKNFGIHVYSVFPGGMRTNFFDEKKPQDFQTYLDPKEVAQKVIDNLKQENPLEELIIKRQ